MTQYLNEPDISKYEVELPQPEYITLPSRINHMQAGANRGFFEKFIQGKSLEVVSMSVNGMFFYALVNGEKHAFHRDDLLSDEDHDKKKEALFSEWMALTEEEKNLILSNRQTPYADE